MMSAPTAAAGSDQTAAFSLAGRLEQHDVTFKALIGNRLGDPPHRTLLIYLPKEYDEEDQRRFPVVYVLHGFTLNVRDWVKPGSLYADYLPRADQLMRSGSMPPVIVVFIDGWTSLGGSQYVDSSGTGRYQQYFVDDIITWVDRHFRTLPEGRHRAVQGHSSGGFGAVYTALCHPDAFAAIGPCAPDALYEVLYPPIFSNAVRLLRNAGATFKQWQTGEIEIPGAGDLQMCQGIAACFSPDALGTPQLPFDTKTGRTLDVIWQEWLAFDPVRLVEQCGDRLAGTRVFLSVGASDEYHLADGAFALEYLLRKQGLHVALRTEETDHCGIAKWLPSELRAIAEVIAH